MAAFYDRFAVPCVFAAPARDLVAALDIPAGARVLDVGTGTGAAALLAMGAGRAVVGIDPSREMLRLARDKGLSSVAAGAVPGLPFPDGAFDRVLASFVLSHCPDYRTALADMVRVLRPGGRLGVTAWGVIENEFTQLWREIAESLIDAQVFAGAIRRALPWEDWFAEAAHLREALTEAGLIRIEVEPREYKTSTSVAEFLALREISVQARILREAVDGAQWERFRERVAREFRARFRDPIEQTRHAHLAIAVRQRHGAGEKLY